MSSIFGGLSSCESVSELYDNIEGRFPGRPTSKSKMLWKLRRKCDIDDKNTGPETILEKAVAMLAKKRHMPDWYNQCPVASGIFGPRSDRKSSVDLAHFAVSNEKVRLIELKWCSGKPRDALRQILRYGVAYIFCRVHRQELPLCDRPLMKVRKIALEVVAPRSYYTDYDESDFIVEECASIGDLARRKTDGELSMSLNALAFPKDFNRIPFESGQDVKEKCLTEYQSEEGKMVSKAFEGLKPAWPAQHT